MLPAVAKIDAGHEDLIHDIAFDFYGQRMATCSSDQGVKVWDFEAEESKGKWKKSNEFKAHDASVLCVAWAHPEFGQVLATCSVDRTVKIWEEEQAADAAKRWTERTRFAESRAAVQDIKFAPKHMGLKLAACSADGFVRIYEAMDVMNLARWNMMEEFEATPSSKEHVGGFCLSWCPSRFHAPMLIVGCGRENVAKIFKYKDNTRRWTPIESLTGHDEVVHDVAWAPNIGRKYHLIATACKDKRVRVFKLQEEADKDRFRVENVGTFDDHGAEVWRVEWNVTGTVLSSSGDDGKVRLWKANYLDEWKCISVINAGDARPTLPA